jgi:Ca2+-binding RTX toxin-like protein
LIWGGAHVANVSTTYDGIGGDDLISVSGGNSLIFGGQGNDKIYDGDGDSFLVGDNGSALLNGGVVQFVTTNSFHHGQDDIIFGGAGDDTIFGGSGGDYINGGPGNNTLIGDQGRYDRNSTNPRGITLLDEFHGGDDVLIGGAGRDLIYGEAGDDTLYGGPGNDSLFGGIGNDKLFGGTGNDILVGGLGADFLDGGFGKDTLYVDFFDVWAGGLPFDTIVGGRFYGCGLKLIGKDADGSGLASPDSAAARLAASFERLRATSFTINSDSINRNYAYLQPSNIIVGASGEQAQQYCMDSVRWGGLGQSYFMLVAREISVPYLIGFGSTFESQWSDLVIWFN